MFRIVTVGLPLAFLAGCTSAYPTYPPEVIAYRTPVDAHSGIRNHHYHDVTRGYTRRAVIDPVRWRDRNVEPTARQEPSS